jgi:hypothetical protein
MEERNVPEEREARDSRRRSSTKEQEEEEQAIAGEGGPVDYMRRRGSRLKKEEQ